MAAFEHWLAQAQAHCQAHGRPLVSLCYAQSLDGSLAARRGQSLALSGPEANQLTHRLRTAHDAILVGVGTVIADNPRLTVRLAEGHHPQPVILDSKLRTPLDAYLVQEHPHNTWIATTEDANPQKRTALADYGVQLIDLPAEETGRIPLPMLLQCLGEMGINSLMVEGGARVITSFLSQRLADQVVLTIAPVYVGGLNAVEPTSGNLGRIPTGGYRLHEIGHTRLGDDLIVWGKL
jgi:riboflavin-specific deaminase-like protein